MNGKHKEKLDLPVQKLNVYHISYVDVNGKEQEFVIRSAVALEIKDPDMEIMKLRKKTSVEVSGKNFAEAMRSYKVNTMMGGGETHADITFVKKEEGGQIDSIVVPGMETPKKIGEWDNIASIKVTYLGTTKAKVTRNEVAPPIIEKPEFGGELKVWNVV